MELYCGIDLHSSNSYVVVMEATDEVIFERRMANDLEAIVAALSEWRERLRGVVVESTYNGYWLIDGLLAAGFHVHLANPAGNKPYSGLKHSDDRWDAHWLARLLRLGLLAEGYIYPREARGLRDLLRRRGQLVRHQTAHILSIDGQIARHTGRNLGGDGVKRLTPSRLDELIGDGDVRLSMESNLAVLHCLGERIVIIEKLALRRLREVPALANLRTTPGLGRILAPVILLETGEIGRFANAGKYASYCRCVDTKRLSNGRKKGAGNRKNGNRYLAWAFIEAAHFAVRYDDRARRFYHRKKAKTNTMVAGKAVAHKLARGCYYVMRDGVAFDTERCFG